MNPQLVLIRLGELTLKGRNRVRFEKAMIQDLEKKLAHLPGIRLAHEFGRIYAHLNGESYDMAKDVLTKIFGIHSFSPVWACRPVYDDIVETSTNVFKNSLAHVPAKGEATFRVTVRRADKRFPLGSMEVGKRIGEHLLGQYADLLVDLHDPDIDLRIEIRQDAAYVFSQVVAGAGGFPKGSNGKALLLISGGIDSPVAGWLALKKGLTIECIHFHSFPYTSERARDKVIELVRKLSIYTEPIKLHLVPLADIQTRLHKEYSGNLEITLTRRMMMRLAERLAEKSYAKALVTGESLGQVASQTLSSLEVIERVVKLPVLRPLIMMDKAEIIAMAERIDTYPISIQPYEDCCTLFIPRSPSTRPDLKKVEELELEMPWLETALDEAIANIETIFISSQDRDQDIDHLF